MTELPAPPLSSPAPPPAQPGATDYELQTGTLVRLASVERGRELLATPDGYTARLSPFDLTAKLQRSAPGSVDDYLAHAAAQVQPFAPEEVEALRHAVDVVRRALESIALTLPLPPVVEVVRTTLAEEGHMVGYTRRHVIVLGPDGLHPRTFAHELFHVLTRHHPVLREQLYQLLGFRLLPAVPPPSDLAERLITNPDAPAIDTAIRVNLDGELVHGAAVLVGSRPYVDGKLGAYLTARLLVLEENASGWSPRRRDGRVVLLDPDEVGGLGYRLGGNTPYDIHPEEVSAEHFVFMLSRRNDLPRPDLIAGMLDVLRGD
jgi:hypothetical protein